MAQEITIHNFVDSGPVPFITFIAGGKFYTYLSDDALVIKSIVKEAKAGRGLRKTGAAFQHAQKLVKSGQAEEFKGAKSGHEALKMKYGKKTESMIECFLSGDSAYDIIDELIATNSPQITSMEPVQRSSKNPHTVDRGLPRNKRGQTPAPGVGSYFVNKHGFKAVRR